MPNICIIVLLQSLARFAFCSGNDDLYLTCETRDQRSHTFTESHIVPVHSDFFESNHYYQKLVTIRNSLLLEKHRKVFDRDQRLQGARAQGFGKRVPAACAVQNPTYPIAHGFLTFSLYSPRIQKGREIAGKSLKFRLIRTGRCCRPSADGTRWQ